ncbi:MAG TPA: molybdopterin cofactor-binding domain-containing protein [Alphaproteobacteria bacterium]|nr:molybdopterin cofactor-binding domain-containing protein [Alphaproteobacteria bacterium]
MSEIGRRARPLDWQAITAGRFVFGTDLALEGMLVGRILRSPHAHARILSLEAEPARRLPGVRAVITAADFAPGMRYLHEGAGDRAPIAGDVVRFVGQEVAAVAADTAEQADAALRAIRVEYRRLDAPFTIDQALAPGAPELNVRTTGRANLARRLARHWGDPEGGRAAGQVSVEGTYWYPPQGHVCMEPNVTVASWDEAKGELHLWTGTQAPIFVLEELAHVLGLEIGRIFCHEIGVGGAFGSKSRISEHEAIACRLSIATRRPVKIALTRSEEFATTKSRHAFRTALRLHADETGRIRALDARIAADNGAYVHSGFSVLSAGPKAFGTLYGVDGLEVEALLVDTSKQPGGQFRGYGTTQSVYALESLMDDLAARLGLDPIELRKRNANRPFTRTVQGARIQSARLIECLDAVRAAIGWDEKRLKPKPGRGVGIATGIHSSGTYARAGANRNDGAIDIYADGSVRVRFGGIDTGTGQRTILAQIAAHELGVDLERVSVLSTETGKTPYDLGAWGTRGTFYSGNAARKTAVEAAARVKALAARTLGNEPVTLEGGMAKCGARAIPIGDLVQGSPDAVDGCLTVETSFVETEAEMLDPKTGIGNLSATYSFAAHAAEVEVDRRTGRVRLLDLVAAHDIGTAINPTMVEGQIAGGVAMSVGVALGEELIHEQGRLVNGTYLNYPMRRPADLPRIRAILVEGGDPKGPYGAKGVGELCVTPGAPAVANAIHHAVGVRIKDLPITPDKILTALAAKEGRKRRHSLWRRPDRWWVALVRWAYPHGVFRLLSRWGVRLARRPGPRPIEGMDMPTSLGDALRALGDSTPITGGTDLLPRRQQGLAAPKRLVSLLDVQEMSKIAVDADGSVSIGAAVSLAQLARELGPKMPMIAEAVEHIASAQIRDMATVGGNLLQEKRCWFYRNGFDCYKRSGFGAPCYAVMGDHRFYHAAIGAHRCQAVTPSDLATVLMALDADAIVAGPSGTRTVPLAGFYSGPGESVLRPDELLTEIRIGAGALARRGRFEKLGLWEGDFAIASVAVTTLPDAGGQWRDPRIVMGGLAPTPWRARATERALDGTALDVAALRRSLDRELDRAAHPLPRNGWKLDAAAGLAEHAVEYLSGSSRNA